MKYLSLIIIFLFSVILQSQTNNDSFFPLAIDNEWNFTSNLFPSTETIIDTTRINGVLYYGLSINSNEPFNFFRKADDKIFVLDLHDSTEVMLFDFDAEVGETWILPGYFSCSYGLEITLLNNEDTVITPLGTFYNCFHFRHSPNCADAGITDTWFAKGIGKVRFLEIFIAGESDFVLTDYIVTSINETYEQLYVFELFQNYPNPFNPKTIIKFRLPSGQAGFVNSGLVTLKVYDVLGEEVATLVNEEKSPGEYQVEFDASNLSSGIYFYKLKTDSYTSTKKMILLR